MINNKGQTLALFIIILPILLILIGGIIDLTIIEYEKENNISLTKEVIKNNISEKDPDKIKKLMEKNGIDEEVKIFNDDNLEIAYETRIDSFLGKFINKDEYTVKIDIVGIQEDGKIKFKKGEYYD